MSLSIPKWKKNFRKIPPAIHERIHDLTDDLCIVACSKKVNIADIEQGMYAHLGIVRQDNTIQFPDDLVPLVRTGNYSKRNRMGRKIVHRDQPKETKSWSIYAPNYGDSSKGYHEVVMEKQVYPCEIEAPKLLKLKIEQTGFDPINQTVIFTFTIDEILDRTAPHFYDEMLYNINLLQENTGNHGVFPANASRDDYLKTLYVTWEILPVGQHDDTIFRILGDIRSKDNTPATRKKLIDRYRTLEALNPLHFIKGTSEFRRYFGAQFADDLVVFENLDYGNALYVMFDDWETLSRKSRRELLSGDAYRFVRIAHTKTWKLKLKALIRRELRKRDA